VQCSALCCLPLPFANGFCLFCLLTLCAVRCCQLSTVNCQLNSIIHFGEDLPEQALQLAFDHSKKADVALIVGTSLRVTPAADLPQNVKRNGGPMICVNLQATGKDQHILASGGILIHAKCDQLMSLLMSKLAVDFTDTTQTELQAEVARFKQLTAKADAEKQAKEQERKKKEEMWAAKAKADGVDLKASAGSAAASAAASASAAAGSAPAKAGAAAGASAGGDAKSAAYPTKFWVGNTNEPNPDKKVLPTALPLPSSPPLILTVHCELFAGYEQTPLDAVCER
jgi:hypothetical protein